MRYKNCTQYSLVDICQLVEGQLLLAIDEDVGLLIQLDVHQDGEDPIIEATTLRLDEVMKVAVDGQDTQEVVVDD